MERGGLIADSGQQPERRFGFRSASSKRSSSPPYLTFRASGRSDSDALFIIKTETEIYLA